jgi:hypothetical protein
MALDSLLESASPYAIGGGAVLDAVGGYFAGQSQNRAMRKARDWSDDRTEAGANRALSALLGPQLAGDYWAGSFYNPMAAASWRRDPKLQQAQQRAGQAMPGYLPVMQGIADSVSARQSGNLGYFDTRTRELAGVDQRYQRGLADQYAAARGQLSSMLAADGTEVLRPYQEQGAGIASMLEGYGQGEEARIRSQMGRAARGSARRGTAALSASGLGNSTTRANFLRENDRTFAEGTEAQVGAARDRSIDRRVSAAQGQQAGEASIRQTSTARRSGTLADMLSREISAGERAGSAALGRAYDRDAQRMGLENANLTRDVTLRTEPQERMLSVMLSGPMNPYLGQSTAQYYPGASGTAQALTSVGGTLGALGSTGLGQANQQRLLQMLMDEMDRRRDGYY